MPSERGDTGRASGRFGVGPARLVARRTGEPAERVYRTETVAGGRVRRGRLLLGHGERRVRPGDVVRRAPTTRTTAVVPVA